MATDVLVKTNFFKKMGKNPVCETVVWPLADRVKNLLEKKWPGQSDSDMASGWLRVNLPLIAEKYTEDFLLNFHELSICGTFLCCTT